MHDSYVESLIDVAKLSNIDPSFLVREFLQKMILYGIAVVELRDYYILQGGTSIRLFYGGPRFSLDLDFTVVDRDLRDLKFDCRRLEGYLNSLLNDLSIAVDVRRERMLEEGRFYRYFFYFDTQKYLGKKIRIKNEILVREKFFEPVEHILEIEYPIKTAVSVLVKKPGQILCDKIASLAGGYHRKLLRWRDIFDVFWLRKNLDAEIDAEYLQKEFGSWLETLEDLENLRNYLKNSSIDYLYPMYIDALESHIPRSFTSKKMFSEVIRTLINTLDKALEVLKQ